MKEICKKCPVKDKSVKACQNRGCSRAVPLPVVDVPVVQSRFPIRKGSTIKGSDFEFFVKHFREDTGDFDALVVSLKDKRKDHGHYGSYVEEGRYYHFKNIQEAKDQMVWEVPSEGTERFHREGSTGAQFLLYWLNDSGFSLDLDT